jgi:lipopolysaccharide transport system ATP-binding protein
MTDQVAIHVEAVSKSYRMWQNPASRFVSASWEGFSRMFPQNSRVVERLHRRARSYFSDFTALSEISLTVKAGESIGIIGRNGSGKSTLLQIIAGILQPTSGAVHVNGRVAALLELGSGFNPEFTGRENVHLSAAILGLTRAEIETRFDSIVAFADIGTYLDQPVKTYSSGMMMRLAFAVNASIDANILIVDEALAVGDAPFQAKCFARMRELVDRGITLLLVTHDLGSVRSICGQTLYLDKGKIHSFGPSKTVCSAYERQCYRDQGIQIPEPETREPTVGTIDRNGLKLNHQFEKNAALQRAGSARIQIIDFCICDDKGALIETLDYGTKVQLRYVIEAKTAVSGDLHVGLMVKDLKGREIFGGTDKDNEHLLSLEAGELAMVELPFSFPLRADRYYITTSIFLFDPMRKFENGTINFAAAELLDMVEYAAFFQVTWDRRWSHYPPVYLPTNYAITPVRSSVGVSNA